MVACTMSTKQRGDDDAGVERDFRDRSTLTAHNYPTKARLHDEQRPGESYEETILRLLDELEGAREEIEHLRSEIESLEGDA